MKRLCLILFVLLIAAPAMAGDWLNTFDGACREEPLQLARMSGPMLGSGGGVVACDDTTGMLVAEDCEGTGYPAGWSDSGTVDWDYTTVHLRGAQSVVLSADLSYSASPTFTATSSAFAHFLFQTPDTPFNALGTIFSFRHSLGSVCKVAVTTQGKIAGYAGTASASDTTVLENDTSYRIWAECRPETSEGANDGILKIWLGSAGTTNRADASLKINLSNGTIVNQIDRIRINRDASVGSDTIFDQVRVKSEEFTVVCE